jgi:hypothetical protein
MAIKSEPITPDDTDAVDKEIAKQTGVLRHVQSAQLIVLMVCQLFVLGSYMGASAFTNTAIGVSVASLALFLCLLPFNFTFRRLSKAAYSAFYVSREFVTSAGERVTFVASNYTGTHLKVRFEDGYEAEYPLYCLTNSDGVYHDWARFKHERYWHLKNLSKVRWSTPEGKVGVIRGIDVPRDRDAVVKLKFEDGQIADFKLGSLEPLVLPARGCVKMHAPV